MLIFQERGELEYPQEKPLGAEYRTNNNSYAGSGNGTWDASAGGERSHNSAIPAPLEAGTHVAFWSNENKPEYCLKQISLLRLNNSSEMFFTVYFNINLIIYKTTTTKQKLSRFSCW